MKRLLLLTAVTMMTVGLAGCHCCDWLWRGSSYSSAPVTSGVMVADPVNTCDPCANPIGGACAPVVPGPGTGM